MKRFIVQVKALLFCVSLDESVSRESGEIRLSPLHHLERETMQYSLVKTRKRCHHVKHDVCEAHFLSNKTPAKAFTLPAETKMGTRAGRAVGYIHLFLFCPTNSFLNQ